MNIKTLEICQSNVRMTHILERIRCVLYKMPLVVCELKQCPLLLNFCVGAHTYVRMYVRICTCLQSRSCVCCTYVQYVRAYIHMFPPQAQWCTPWHGTMRQTS